MAQEIAKMPSQDEKDLVTDESVAKAYEYDEQFSSEKQRSILRRVDLRLIAATGLGYSISLMDRGNVSMAAIAGMIEDLDLGINYRYSLIVLIFFVPYALFQPPATILIRKIGPPNFLSTIVLCWGLLSIGMGFSKTWTDVLALRIVLGICTSGFFPGCVYLLSCWYLRYEVQKRFSVFYGIGCVVSAFTGILSYGLTKLDGADGISGWSWIFIVEGVITLAIGIVSFVFIVDFPDKAHRSWGFLNKDECDFIIRRINRDRADGELEAFSLAKFLKPALDLKIWGFSIIFFCLTTNTYAMAYFLPIILSEGMGFGVGTSQCLTTPPWVFAGIMMFATAWVGDKYRTRAPLLVANALLSIIGIPLMGFASNNGARLVGVFLTVAGANANVPACMAWQANNIRGQWTRAFSSATLVAFDGIGGMVSSIVFGVDAPAYRPGLYTALGANVLILIVVAALTWWFRHCNKQADRGERIIEGAEGFRYTI